MITPNRGSRLDRANLLLRPCADEPREPAATTDPDAVADPVAPPRGGVGTPHDRDGTPSLPRRHHHAAEGPTGGGGSATAVDAPEHPGGAGVRLHAPRAAAGRPRQLGQAGDVPLPGRLGRAHATALL